MTLPQQEEPMQRGGNVSDTNTFANTKTCPICGSTDDWNKATGCTHTWHGNHTPWKQDKEFIKYMDAVMQDIPGHMRESVALYMKTSYRYGAGKL